MSENEKFVIDNDLKADWAIEKISQHKKSIADYEKSRDEFIAEYTKRIEMAKSICAESCDGDYRAIDHLTDLLREYASTKDARTLKFPQGNLSFRKQPTQFFFTSNGESPSAKSQQLIDYCRKIDRNLIITTESADWARFKRRLKVDASKNNEIIDTVTGEVITDIYAVTPPDKFVVNTTEV